MSRVVLGRVSGLFGVRGWVKVYSHTEPRENIASYRRWYLQREGDWHPVRVEQGRRHGKGVVVKLAGVEDRDRAAALIGCDIAIDRDQLPPLPPGEYYWTDLEGLRVVTLEGTELGRVSHLFATGANDVMVVTGERERLLPFVQPDIIRRVDPEQGLIEVDWDPEF
ncbi:MAG TPA: ribosome maturation factor RimM [Thiohalobacter sp.]|nr:ribosome maturation factor RimM [Thiohalobacter sp.]